MILDVFVVEHSLAFEYHGEQHYTNISALTPLWQQTERDKEKREVCKENSITMIEIPFWWDWKRESLVATILNYKGDLSLTGGGIPIPNEPPKK